MGENESQDSTPISHPRANPAVQAIHFLQVKVPTPAGIVTWTTSCFSKVVLNIEFKGMYKKAGIGCFLNLKSVRSIFFSFGHTIITYIHKVSVFVVSDCP